MFLAVGPHGGIPPLKQVVVDLADTAGARLALVPQVGLEVGHPGLFWLGSDSRRIVLRLRFSDTPVDVEGGGVPHIVRDMGIDVQRGGPQ